MLFLAFAGTQAHAQMVSGRSKTFTYTYGLIKYYSKQEFEAKIPVQLVKTHAPRMAKSLAAMDTLFVPQGITETNAAFSERRARASKAKYQVLWDYKKQMTYDGMAFTSGLVLGQAHKIYFPHLKKQFGHGASK